MPPLKLTAAGIEFSMPASNTELNQARAAKSKAMALFKGVRTLRSIGITKNGDRYGLKVNLERKPASGASLPREVDGVPISFEIVGRIGKRVVKAA